MYRICTEYKIEKLSLREKTDHDAIKWYRKYHQAKCDSLFFNKLKPAKNFDEKLNQLAKQSAQGVEEAGRFFQEKGGQAINFIGEKGKDIKLDQVASSAKEGIQKAGSDIAAGAVQLKEHLIKQEFSKKIFSFFGGKKNEEGAGKLDEEP